MTRVDMFEQYIAAFNAGESESYRHFYTPDIVFRNGAGAVLTGPAAIVRYYDDLKPKMKRVIDVRGLVEGCHSLGAALASRFIILADGVSFAGQVLNAGDRVYLESIALYELDGDRFARIEANTLNRRVERQREAGQ